MSVITKVGGGFLALACIGLGALYVTRQVAASPSALPACEAPEVAVMAYNVAAKTVPYAFAFDSYGTVEAESTDLRRVCRVHATKTGTDADTWLNFTLERHGEGQVFIKFAD